MSGQLAYVLRLIESGHLNYPCSTQVDVTMAQRAIDAAILADAAKECPRCQCPCHSG